MATVRAVAASPLVRRLAATFAISAAGLGLLRVDEGSRNKVYLDPVGIPTVCVGHTSTVSRKDVGKVITDSVCEDLLRADSKVAQRAVNRLVTAPVTQDQYDALVSFTFNVGAGNVAKSTLLRKLNAGDCHGAAAEFPKWNKAKGQVLPGLTTRRMNERIRFERDCP